MLTPETLPPLQALLSEQRLDGWLLFDFRGRNPIAAATLGDWIVGTRHVFVLLPQTGVPHALVHEIDAELWGPWPSSWMKSVWVYQSDLEQLLEQHVRGQKLAVDYSPHAQSPYLDCVPAGVFDFLWNYAGDLVPSADLVTKFLSVWTEEDRESHERAAARIAEIAGHAMARVAECARSETPLSEYALSEWIRNAFDRDGLVTTSGPTVSLGANSARNHYEPRIENSAVLVPGQLLLVDLWAKEPGGIYADQTWMATIGPPSERDAWLWTVVRSARDAALALLKDRVDRRVAVTGAVVDIAARRVISEAGLGAHVAGRTGHSIDRFGLHGFGPPIDGTETHDDRLLLPGVGFSIEPGVYVKGQTGLRSEVNVYLTEDRVVVTPHTVQNELIVL